MNPDSERLVRETWTQLTNQRETLTTQFYARLFDANPATRELFKSTDMVEQRRKFGLMLDEIIRVLDNPDLLVSEVAASGRRHVRYGVRDRDYEDVGAALLWAVAHVLGPAYTPEVRDAWREAYALLAAVMRRAASTDAASTA